MTSSRHIALFTDFGNQDAYVAQLKGVILSINPGARLIDLSHQVTPFDLRHAAYLLEQATRFFPPSVIVVAVVDPGVGSDRHPIGLRTKAHKYYIGPDNGLFSRVVESEQIDAVHVLRNVDFFRHPEVSMTFHGRDIFAPVAAHLSLGVELQALGPAMTDLLLLPSAVARIDGRTVSGEVMHVDHFGNIISTITQRDLEPLQVGDEVVVSIAGTTYHVPYCSTYADAKPDQLICLINSAGAFELAKRQQPAAATIGIKGGESLIVSY